MIMRIHLTLWIGIVLLFVFSQFAGLWGATLIEGQRHFRATLPPQQVDILHIIQTAQQLNYWIRIQTGEDVMYLKGQTPCSACDPSQEASFFTTPQLHVDGQNFWIRLDEQDWRLNLRPAASGLELIVSPKLPKTELTTEDLNEIRSALGPFGLLPAELSFEPLVPPAKPVPPEGVRLDSILYGLMLAPDWKLYAQEKGLELSGLRARVLVELTSAEAQPPVGLDLVIEARNGPLVRAQALIHRLEELARDPIVAFVRPPAQPQPPMF